MNEFVDYIVANTWALHLVMTVALLLSLLLLRWLLGRSLRRVPIKSVDLRRRWMIQVRNLCFALFALGVITIWASELRTFAISIAAVLVAFVLASKELILCLTGSFLKITSGSFTVGDRIEVNGIKGEVVDQTLLATRVMEIGPGTLTHQFTGRTVTLPNALFLTSPVINENLVDEYVIQVMSFPVKASEDCAGLAKNLERIAIEVCADYLVPAKHRLNRLVEKEGLDTPSVEPRVSLEFPEPDRVNLLLRMPLPSNRRGITEREVRYRFMDCRGLKQPTSDTE